MFDRLEVRILSPGVRYPAEIRLWVNGADLVGPAVGPGGCGPFAPEALSAGGRGSLHATGEPRRVELGEPECTGGCCGFLAAVVQRLGDVVQWSDWEVPAEGTAPTLLHFAAAEYDAELARAGAVFRRNGHPSVQ